MFTLGRDLKATIIAVLALEYPLQVHGLQEKIRERRQKTFTTQAIHKALNQLMHDGVVLKKSRAYQLKTDYILKVDGFVQMLKSNYFFKSVQSFQVAENSKKIFKVPSVAALDQLWNEILREKLSEYPINTQVFVQHFPHAWFNLVHMGEEIKIVNAIVENCKNFYTLVNGSTQLDEWIGKFYQGKKMYYQMKHSTDSDENGHCYGVIGNYIIETRYPRNIADKLDSLFGTSKNLQDLQISELLSVAYTPTELALTLQNNKSLANHLRSKILKEFERQHN